MSAQEYNSHPTFSDVTAFILTGGRSQRMGHDKALLRLPNGMTLLEHAAAVAGAVASEVRIIGPRHRYAHFAWAGEILEDLIPDRGPLGGIHAGLSGSDTEWNLVLAVDLPKVTPELLSYLITEAKRYGKQVTVPSIGERLQPLCAVYRRGFRARAAAALEANRNKIDAAFDPSDTCILAEAGLLAAGFSPALFENVNTPEDFAALAQEK